MNVEAVLTELEISGNLRRLPGDIPQEMTDFTSNDYLGFGSDESLRRAFFNAHDPAELAMTSSASRLLAGNQSVYTGLEHALAESYGRNALLFNSGYHANTGILPAISGEGTLILADRLVHASIIDGIRLATASVRGVQFRRFPHNDFNRLESMLKAGVHSATSVVVVVESVYSMDGDRADLRHLVELKKRYPGIILYVDEAHAVGVSGPGGLGESAGQGVLADIDIMVGTFGKALASFGAFAIVSETMRRYLINRSRPLIFSTSLAPAQTMWTEFMWRHALGADTAREMLRRNSEAMARIIPGGESSHIRPLIVGNARKAMELSEIMRENGFNILPIRTPTVPPGTERLRFSVSANIAPAEIDRLAKVLIENPINES